nr:B3 DNA binding domain-containing protein [Tanacetum cinerariifolium]
MGFWGGGVSELIRQLESHTWKQKKAVEIKNLQKKPTSPAKQTSRQKKAIKIKDKSLQKKATSPTKQTVEA